MTMDSLAFAFDEQFGPEAARQAAFREATAASVDVVYDRGGTFSAQVELHQIGQIGLGLIEAAPYTAIRSMETLQRTTVDHVYIDCFTQAGFDGTMHGAPIRVEDGDCVVFDQTCLMRLEFNQTRCIFLIVPRAMFEARVGAAATEMDGFVLRGSTAPACMLRRLLEAALETIGASTDTFRAELGAGLVNLAAACLRSEALARPAPDEVALPPYRSRRNEATPVRIERFIARNLARRELDATLICKVFSVSRSSLYRMFNGHGGLNAYLVEQRAAAAHQLLCTNSTAEFSVKAVAEQVGFAEERTLRRAMRRIYGVAPGSLRRSAPKPKHPRNPRQAVSDFYDLF